MVIDPREFLQYRFIEKPKPSLLQLIGEAGSGCHRLAFDFLKPVQRVAWLSPHWDLYAPLLWKMASDQHIDLVGVECSDRRRLRNLLKEILNSGVFDGLVLDRFSLNAGEGFFLQKLLFPFAKSMRSLVIDSKPHSFCLQRARLSLSHRKFRIVWGRGGDPTPIYKDFPYLTEIQSEGSECSS